MLQLATPADQEEMYRMATSFFYVSPYKDMRLDESRVQALVSQFAHTTADNLCLLWVTDKPVGMLAALATPGLFSWGKVATEIIFWVDEDARKSKAAFSLINAYEYWARAAGCEYATLVDIVGNLSKLYIRKGFMPREDTYVKEL